MPKDRKESTFFAVFWLVGPAGFEPAECGSQSPVPYHLAMAHYCRTANPHANLPFLILNGVGDGTRTHDNQNHNLALYQLNYTHHIGAPKGTRTPGPLLRRQLLYPPELQAHMERVMGIEPTRPAWKAGVLPLNYTRICRIYTCLATEYILTHLKNYVNKK